MKRSHQLASLLSLLRPYRARSAAALASLLAGTAISLLPPLLAKEAIDSGIVAHRTSVLVLMAFAFILSAGLVWATTYAQTYLIGWVGQRVLADLRIRVYAHLQQMPIGFYESRPTGVLISRLTNDVEALDTLVTDSVVTLFQAGLTLIGTVVLLLVLDARLALLTFLVLLPMAALTLWFRIASTGAFRATRETIGALTAYLQETISGVRVVRSFGQEQRHEARFAELNAANRQANMRTVHLNAGYFPAVELLSGLAVGAIVFYGGSQAIEGTLSVGTIVAFVAAMANLFDPIQQLSQLYTTYQSGMAALEKIFQLLAEQPAAQELDGQRQLPELRGSIDLEDVSFSYGDPGAGATYALNNVELHVPAGQTLALVGATGAGKSTIAKLLARFYNPSSGRVRIDGIDLREAAAGSLRRQLGIVPQEAFLFSGTIAENIAFGSPEASAEQIRQAARQVGADEMIQALPNGYQTQIGERGVQLSGGQRQLIAFARALIGDPRILILDEATSSVDLRSEARIQRALRELLAGRTAIVIAHRLSTIRDADLICLIEHGRIAERGSHAQLLAAGGRYARIYGAWSQPAA